VAFYFKKINGSQVFIAGIIAEMVVICIFFSDIIGYLWLNAIGCLLVILLSFTVYLLQRRNNVIHDAS
jgi:hypothetical protein